MQTPSLVNFIVGVDKNFVEKESMHYCSCCKKYFPRSMFYSVSKDKSKPRNQCKNCWNRLNGKNPEKPNDIINTLELFLEDEIKENFLLKELNIDPNRYIQTKYAAQLLNLNVNTVADYCKKGKITSKKDGNRHNVHLLSLLQSSELALENFIKDEKLHKIIDIVKQCQYGGEMTISHEKNNCNFNALKETNHGIYFIVQFLNGKLEFSERNVLIQKVGKADGEYGLNGRMYGYNADNTKKPDISVTKFYNTYKDILNGVTLHIFYMCLETIETTIPGNFTIRVSKARETEKLYAFYARAQGHPLLFSSFD
nr:MAG: hypothetical protein [Caudoviricetes sp.]